MLAFVRNLFRKDPRGGRVVLRDESTSEDTRHLSASYSESGDLVIEGQDFGAGVEDAFGYREYEWAWTIKEPDLAALSAALSDGSNLLDALARRFSGPNAAFLFMFLTENKIPFEKWSRIGD